MSYEATRRLGGAADALLAALDGSLSRMLDGTTPHNDHGDHDQLMHALGTALMRARAMGGDVQAAVNRIEAGAAVLNYCSTFWKLRGRWPVLESNERPPLEEAIDTYRTILLASSPLQMESAWRAHLADVEQKLEAAKRG